MTKEIHSFERITHLLLKNKHANTYLCLYFQSLIVVVWKFPFCKATFWISNSKIPSRLFSLIQCICKSNSFLTFIGLLQNHTRLFLCSNLNLLVEGNQSWSSLFEPIIRVNYDSTVSSISRTTSLIFLNKTLLLCTELLIHHTFLFFLRQHYSR